MPYRDRDQRRTIHCADVELPQTRYTVSDDKTFLLLFLLLFFAKKIVVSEDIRGYSPDENGFFRLPPPRPPVIAIRVTTCFYVYFIRPRPSPHQSWRYRYLKIS